MNVNVDGLGTRFVHLDCKITDCPEDMTTIATAFRDEDINLFIMLIHVDVINSFEDIDTGTETP